MCYLHGAGIECIRKLCIMCAIRMEEKRKFHTFVLVFVLSNLMITEIIRSGSANTAVDLLHRNQS